jgi:hypothetical protein
MLQNEEAFEDGMN